MHPFVFVPLAAAVSACAMAGAAWGRDPSRPPSRVLAGVLLACGFWSLCQVAWSLAGSAQQALTAARLACLGFLWLGPLSLHLHATLQPEDVAASVLNALSLSPADRYQTAHQFGEAVTTGASGKTRVLGPRQRKKKWPLWAGVATAAVAATMMLWWKDPGIRSGSPAWSASRSWTTV